MGVPRSPAPVTPFVAVLAADPAVLAAARRHVEAFLGPVGCETEAWPFDATDYYAREMGPALLRQFWGFERLASPEGLADWKIAAEGIERRLAGVAGRRVNLDPGYVGLPHVGLASTKAFAHRVYLRDGVYAEVTLLWQAGKFVTLPWTFPEYRTVPVQTFLARVRTQLHTAVQAPASSSDAAGR